MQIAKSKKSRKLAGSIEVKHYVLAAIRRVAMPNQLEAAKPGSVPVTSKQCPENKKGSNKNRGLPRACLYLLKISKNSFYLIF